MAKSKRTKATDVKPKVRHEVMQRDHYCVHCGSNYNLTIAHLVPRSKGGLGIKENLCVLCMQCHHHLDNGLNKHQRLVKETVTTYMHGLYPNITAASLKHRKEGLVQL